MALLVCGTPGVGKTTFCEELATRTGFKHVQVGILIEEKKLYSEWDDENNCSIFDEDLVADEIEEQIDQVGVIVDFHSVKFLPADMFQLIVVLRCESDVLWKRLEKRNYQESKIRENVECEIFQVILDDCREHFEDVRMLELDNTSLDQLEGNIDKVMGVL